MGMAQHDVSRRKRDHSPMLRMHDVCRGNAPIRRPATVTARRVLVNPPAMPRYFVNKFLLARAGQAEAAPRYTHGTFQGCSDWSLQESGWSGRHPRLVERSEGWARAGGGRMSRRRAWDPAGRLGTPRGWSVEGLSPPSPAATSHETASTRRASATRSRRTPTISPGSRPWRLTLWTQSCRKARHSEMLFIWCRWWLPGPSRGTPAPPHSSIARQRRMAAGAREGVVKTSERSMHRP